MRRKMAVIRKTWHIIAMEATAVDVGKTADQPSPFNCKQFQ